MSEKKNNQPIPIEYKLIPYCNQIIIAILIIIIIAVPLYFDIHLHSVFDLSKITILYVLTFTMLAAWSIKTIITCRQFRHEQLSSTLPEHTVEGKDTHAQFAHSMPEAVARGRPLGNPQIRLVRNSLRRTSASYAQQLFKQPLSLPIVAFLFVSGLATIFSINPYLSLVGNYVRYEGFISIIVYISLFFVIINFIDKRRLSLFLNIIILTACVASIYGILQHFGLDFHQWNTIFGHRVPSTFGHPAFFSAFLTMVIPLILIKIFVDSRLRYSTFLYIGILALLIIAFYYTKTRASFVGLIISNLFFFSFIGKKNLLANKTKTIVTITIIIGLSVFFNVNNEASVIGRFVGDIKPTLLDNKQSPPFQEDTKTPEIMNRQHGEHSTKQDLLLHSELIEKPTETEFSLPQDHSNGDIGVANQLGGTMRMRVFQYLTGLKIIHDYPILGIGPDTLGMIYPQYLSKVFKEKDEHRYLKDKGLADRIHNDFLDITVSRGLLGLGVYAWFIFAYARMIWKGCKKANGYDKILIIGLCTSSLAYFVQNQFGLGHVSIITLFWFLIAMSVIACPIRYLPANAVVKPEINKLNLTKRIGSLTLGRFGKHIFCGIIVCLMILLIILSLFRYKADLYFENGRRLIYKREIPEAIQSYAMAVKHNPLALNYRNVLNRIYLKMAVIGMSKGQGSITEDQPNTFSREQTTMWITNAIAGAEEVQKLYPRDYHSAFTLGQAYHLLDKISPARLSHSRPNRFDGQAGRDEDTSKDAIKYYKKAIMLRPFRLELRNKLAQFYAEKDQYKDAIHELKEAKNISPDNQESYLNLAKVYMNDNERYEEAEAVLLEFNKKNPDHARIDVHRLLNNVYVKTAKWEEVLRQSKKIIKLDQKDLDAHKYTIMASLKLERYDDARSLCYRILELSGSQDNTHSKFAKEILERLSEK